MSFDHAETLKALNKHIPGFADYEVVYEYPVGFWTVILKTHTGKEYAVSITKEHVAQVPLTLIDPDQFAIYVSAKLYESCPELAHETAPTKLWSSPKPVPNFAPLVASETAVVALNDNLTQFAKDMKPIFEHMSKTAQTLGDNFIDIAKAMEPLKKALEAHGTQEMAPGIAISEHEDMHKILANCPVVDCATNTTKIDYPLYHLIQHLNDHHQWEREHIADWLDTLPKQPVFYPEVDDGEALYA